MHIFLRDRSTDVSLPKAVSVHGIKIEKVPCGKYIAHMSDLQSLPKLLADKCYPGQSFDDLLSRAKRADRDFILDLMSRLLLAAPELVLDLAGQFVGSDKAALEALSPSELLDVLEAWWKLNDLSNFFKRAWAYLKPMLTPQASAGFSAGSPSRSK